MLMTYKTLKVKFDKIHLNVVTPSFKLKYSKVMMVDAILDKCNVDTVISLDLTVGVSRFHMNTTSTMDVMSRQKTPEIKIRLN